MKRTNKEATVIAAEAAPETPKMKRTIHLPAKGEWARWTVRFENCKKVVLTGICQGIVNNQYLIRDSNGRKHWIEDVLGVSLRAISYEDASEI